MGSTWRQVMMKYVKSSFIVLICLVTVSCREQVTPPKMFSLYEGTEHIISIISNTCFTVQVSHWENVNVRNTEYSEAQSAEMIASFLPVLKKSTPTIIKKKLTPSEYETQYGIPIVEIAPQGVVSLRSIIDPSENIEISCNNTYGPYPRITIICKEIIMTYTYEDAVQIKNGICKILSKQVRQ